MSAYRVRGVTYRVRSVETLPLGYLHITAADDRGIVRHEIVRVPGDPVTNYLGWREPINWLLFLACFAIVVGILVLRGGQ